MQRPCKSLIFLFSLTEVGGNLDSQEGGIPSEFSPIIEIAAGNVFEPTTSTRRQARHATTCQHLARTQLTQVSQNKNEKKKKKMKTKRNHPSRPMILYTVHDELQYHGNQPPAQCAAQSGFRRTFDSFSTVLIRGLAECYKHGWVAEKVRTQVHAAGSPASRRDNMRLSSAAFVFLSSAGSSRCRLRSRLRSFLRGSKHRARHASGSHR